MTTEQTAQQLELAAQILRTGHPWEFQPDHSQWILSGGRCPLYAIGQRWPIRPVLATPPDNRQIHNPDNLTAEQVGVGYRLTLKDDSCDQPHELWSHKDQMWVEGARMVCTFEDAAYSYRLPLSVPWPEPADPYAELKAAPTRVKSYTGGKWHVTSEGTKEIKPNPAPQPSDQAQLPPPPPGMSWHRTDGWKDGDLPQGYRPHVEGETDAVGDELRTAGTPGIWKAINFACNLGSTKINNHRRTTRPLTFEHAGKTWTYHRPGDPMPCDGNKQVVLLRSDREKFATDRHSALGKEWAWGDNTIIGWRYAEPATKTVPLGPDDIPPCSVFRVSGVGSSGWHQMVLCPQWGGSLLFSSGASASCEELMRNWQINRSIPLTGKWNPDAWEPCSKTIPA